MCSNRIPTVERLMPDYTPVEQNWLRVFTFPGLLVYEQHPTKYSQSLSARVNEGKRMEITRALSALQPLYGKGNIEIVTEDGHRVRGIVRSMKTTQALTTPSVKVERADGEIVKVPFSSIIEIINHNPPA